METLRQASLLEDEDPPCECIQISEDIDDASTCPIHGKPPAQPEVEFLPAPADPDVAF